MHGGSCDTFQSGQARQSAIAGHRLQVVGHTETKPVGGDAQELSVLRANAVRAFLANAKGGKLPASTLSAAGYGDADPAASGPTPDAQKKNRRIEIVILPADDEVH